MRNWLNLSDYEFEAVAGDLVGAEEGCVFSRSARGRDGGVDLRRDGENGPWVIQAKHYVRSTAAHLEAVARKEAVRLAQMRPSRYWLVTSRSVSHETKTRLSEMLGGATVLGVEDLEQMLDAHPEVERRHPKLFLASGAAFRALTQPGTHHRSRRLLADIAEQLPLWVQTKSFFEASKLLEFERVCVIAGPPGIGKTTLAHMLVVDAVDRSFEPIEISADVSEGWDALDGDVPQIFFYDDFLGQTSLNDLTKNEDRRIAQFIRAIRASEKGLFVLSTREHILQRALSRSDTLRRSAAMHDRFVLELESYDLLDKAKMMHNHIWHSAIVTSDDVRSLIHERRYNDILSHANFSPRIIEQVTGSRVVEKLRGERGWIDMVTDVLDHPELLWRVSWDSQLAEPERVLLHVMAGLAGRSSELSLEDTRRAHETTCEALGVARAPRRFETALRILEGGWLSISPEGGGAVRAANPGVVDFVQGELAEDVAATRALLHSVTTFEQLLGLWSAAARTADAPARAAFADPLVPKIAGRTLHEGVSQYGYDRGPSVELRLVSLLEVIRSGAPDPQLTVWWADAARLQSARWGADPTVEPRDAITLGTQLLRMLDWSLEHVGTAWPAGLAGMLSDAALSATEWRLGAELREAVPPTFDDDQWAGYRRAFARWATERLKGRLDEFDVDEVHATRQTARALDVVLDEALYANAIADTLAWGEKVRVARPIDRPNLETHKRDAELFALFAGLLDRDE